MHRQLILTRKVTFERSAEMQFGVVLRIGIQLTASACVNDR